MLTPLHSVIDRGEYEKYFFLPLYGNMKFACDIALAVIELRLSEGISQIVSQIVRQSVENLLTLKSA